MLSNSSPEEGKNYGHNVFLGVQVRSGQSKLFNEFLSEQDLSVHTVEALISDLRKFSRWFTAANKESFDVERVTVRDITDFRDHLRRDKRLIRLMRR